MSSVEALIAKRFFPTKLITRIFYILCYWTTDSLGISQRELVKRLKLSQPAVSQAVRFMSPKTSLRDHGKSLLTIGRH